MRQSRDGERSPFRPWIAASKPARNDESFRVVTGITLPQPAACG